MDLEPHDEDYGFLYSDYYSTGGRYRPPKRPRNYGWMVAVLGLLLLCMAGGMALSRAGEESATAAARSLPGEEEAGQETRAVQTAEMPSIFDVEPTAAVTPAVSAASDGQLDSAAPGSTTTLVLSDSGGEELSLPEIYQKTISSVASITAVSPSAKSTGTGIVMSRDGYIITNYHVVAGAQSVTVLLEGDRELPASWVGGDETSDLAVLRVEADDLVPAEFGSSDDAQVGETVVAIGDPLGTELRGTMTDGIICGIQRNVQLSDRTMTLMQTNAALNSGNSGGPLVNLSGKVIGINTMKLSSSYKAVEGIGFAIPMSAAAPIINELIEKGYVSGRPAFGFSVESLSTQMRLFYGLPGVLYIRSVAESSDAFAQGIREGDVILALDGQMVGSLDEFNAIKNEHTAGDTVSLTVFRKGEELEFSVTLMDRADLD